MLLFAIKACFIIAGILLPVGLLILIFARNFSVLGISFFFIIIAAILSIVGEVPEEQLIVETSTVVEQSEMPIIVDEKVKEIVVSEKLDKIQMQENKDREKEFMFSSLLLVKFLVGGLSLGGGYYLLKRVTRTESEKQLLLEQKIEKQLGDDQRVELEANRDLIILQLKKYSLDPEFTERLAQVHEIFEKRNFQHPRAHTFYNLLLPKLLKVKKARKELSSMTDADIDTQEMYASLNAWMDDIIAHKIDGLEGEAEINAKVITLLTK